MHMRYYYKPRGGADAVGTFARLGALLDHCDVEILALQKQVEQLTSEVEYWKIHGVGGMSWGIRTVTNINVNTKVKQQYIDYILKYGVPDDGFFEPALLYEFV